ncbi:MAG: hypothetical protein ACK46Q_12820 [Hyphomonas sp.]
MKPEPLDPNDKLTDHELQSYVDGKTTFIDLYITRLMARDLLAARAAFLEELQAALKPFAEFARASSFDKLPDDTPMTQGSRFARRQVTAGDFKRALTALSSRPDTEGGA